MRTLTVTLGERSYPIHVGEGLLARVAELVPLPASRRAVIVTNSVVAALHLDPLRASLDAARVSCETIVIPDGEAHKDWATLYSILTKLIELRAERSTLLVALGGGVVGDLAGFAAATYQRGMPLLQVPTTLLAQVDSSVGGKTAVNHPLGKNMIGAFHQPAAVVTDTATLSTLPDREFVAGLAEVIKYGAVCDATLFAWLETHLERLLAREPEAVAHAILESCRIKAEIVAADEREAGLRALLNYGHTFGHAIEAGTGYGAWLHGEAVAAGMTAAASLSHRVTGMPVSDVDRIARLLSRANLPTRLPSFGFERWIELMSHDKKSDGGAMRFVLLTALGKGAVHSNVTREDLRAVLAA